MCSFRDYGIGKVPFLRCQSNNRGSRAGGFTGFFGGFMLGFCNPSWHLVVSQN